jgi:hypothetical protein
MGNLGGALNAVLLVILCTCYVDVAKGQRTDSNDGNVDVCICSIHLFGFFRQYLHQTCDNCSSRDKKELKGVLPPSS